MATRTTEKTLDLALERVFNASPIFLRWFLERTRFAAEDAKIVLTRANSPWGKARLRVWNEAAESYEAVDREGETDVLVVLQSKRRGRFALHLENKLANGSFTLLQPEAYRARAAAWAGKQKYGDYEEWETVLVAPQAFYEKNQYDSMKFDRFVSHEQIAPHIPEFLQTAVA
jgi:hypothetical protein